MMYKAVYEKDSSLSNKQRKTKMKMSREQEADMIANYKQVFVNTTNNFLKVFQHKRY